MKSEPRREGEHGWMETVSETLIYLSVQRDGCTGPEVGHSALSHFKSSNRKPVLGRDVREMPRSGTTEFCRGESKRAEVIPFLK